MVERFTVVYHPDVIKKDQKKLSATIRKQIGRAISSKLTTQPHIYGKPLRNSLKGYRKLRVGDYRVVYSIEDSVVKVHAVQHRSIVYNPPFKRVF